MTTIEGLEIAGAVVAYGLSLSLVPRVVLARRDSAATLSWILVLVFLPLLGVLLYWTFGEARLARHVRKRRDACAAVAEALTEIRGARGGAGLAPPEEDRSLVEMVTRVAEELPLPGNSVKIFTDAHEATDAMLAAIGGARSTVHLEVYQFKADESGRRYLDALTNAARRGVRVRVLYDDVGSLWTRRSFFRPLDASGGEVEKFLPVRPFRGLFRANLRNHRKILVVDGAVAYTGGLNVGNEYGGWRQRKFDPWRDTHVELRGPAVAPLQDVFVQDWHFATKRDVDPAQAFPPIPPSGNEWVHVLASGPDSDWEAIHHAIFTQITQAKSHVYLTTPYFVPDRSMLVALQTAALRGVDVRVLLPARSDQHLVRAAARYHYAELLRAGIRVFEYEGAMLHAKTVEVDGRSSTIGSANLDLRSFRLNFELNLLVYGESVGRELERIFLADLNSANELKRVTVENWPLTKRLVHGAARLLEPLL